jgi:mRNA interferase MazF
MPTVTYNPFDVVVVPFPFTDRSSEKRRPAVVLSAKSFQSKTGHSLLAMITSLENPDWFLDVEIENLDLAGLPAPSKIRMKLFTLDDALIVRKIGTLAKNDAKRLRSAVKRILD